LTRESYSKVCVLTIAFSRKPFWAFYALSI